MPESVITSLHEPDQPLPLIFDSPHSGRQYPEDFRFSCPFSMLQKAEDNYVDELFADAPAYGASLLCALFPRTYIDVNRGADDLDPDLLAPGFDEEWPDPVNPTARSYAGIGLIRRVVRPGIAVYDRKLSISEVRHRIENYYEPYHKQLAALIERHHYRFGQVWHINCHSMPQGGGFGRMLSHSAVSALPDFVLGDRDGTSCDLAFTHALRDFLRGLGYRVYVNNPYRGVELVRRYASPATGRHSIQIEVSKALYWNEVRGEKTNNFNRLRSDINKLMEYISRYVTANLNEMAAD